MSDVEVQKFTPENENEVAEEVKYGKYEDTKQKYWDEVEMKHHGLVDEHAHHKETAGPQLSQPKYNKNELAKFDKSTCIFL